MQIINGVYFFPRESDSVEGVAVRPPKTYPEIGKKYAVAVLIHGVGERGQGDVNALLNVVDGYDYDGAGPLPRQYAIETPQFEALCEKYQIIGVTVNYPKDFTPSDVDYVLDMVESKFNVDTSREVLIGFSWGGKAVLDYVTSSLHRAKRCAFVVAAAPVNTTTSGRNVIDAGLQFIGTTYETDPTVSPTNVKNFVNSIAGTVPKPVLITFPGNAHGGFTEMINYPPIFEYLLKTSRDNRIQYVHGTGTVPVDPLPPVPAIPTAVATYIGVGPAIFLIGNKSTGWKTGYEGSWSLISGPAGVTAKQVFPGGSSFINANATLPVQGTYVFRLTLQGALLPADVTVVYGTVVQPPPVPKEVISFDSATDYITYKDGSTETAKAVYSNGTWTVKNAAGQVITF
jgi:pimeloyl-ACP methyl ester carboxylesterase